MTDFRENPQAHPIEGIDQLVEQFHAAGKPRDAWRVGTEYEKVVVDRATGRAAPFSGRRGIEALLRGLADGFGWERKEESGRTVALARDGASVTLEPGGQLELSGAPCATIHETRAEFAGHVRELRAVTADLGLAVLGLGMQPLSRVEEIEWVPKRRYEIMGPYMSRVGRLGHRMMKQTATVQANIDYADERDAMRKLRVGMGIAPLVTAIFANSSVADGDLNGWMSFRGHVWTDTDPARCGLLPFAFRPDSGFADYVTWALDVPLYFILREGRYVTEVTGLPFRRFLTDGAGGTRATLDDWNLHLTTLFPEVRLKGYLELRSADSQPPERMLALPALVKGVFYTADCLDAAWDLVKPWSLEERLAVLRDVHRVALEARCRGLRLAELARELVEIASEGLRRQRALDDRGDDEQQYLEPVAEEVARARTPAGVVAERWVGPWDRRIERLVEYSAYRGGGAAGPRTAAG
jgi:glutamate--cysteine ligase